MPVVFKHTRPGLYRLVAALTIAEALCTSLWCRDTIGLYMYMYATVGCVIVAFLLIAASTRRYLEPEGKAILVTGCDSGIGRHLVQALDGVGCVVFAGCLYLNGEEAKSLRASCSNRIKVVQLDVTKDNEVDACISLIRREMETRKVEFWGIVNNAGLDFPGRIELVSVKHFKEIAEVNLYGMIRVTKACLTSIKRTKGRIVNVTSVKGRICTESMAVYGTSKWGAEGYSNCLRMDMRKNGVKVVLVEPCMYGGATKIFQEHCIKRKLAELWQEASVEVRSELGEDYIEECIDWSVKDESCQDLHYLSDAFIDGLFAVNPKVRYLVAGSNKRTSLGDTWFVAALLSNYLPFSWTDWLVENYFKMESK